MAPTPEPRRVPRVGRVLRELRAERLMDKLLWDVLLNVESHRERVRFRVECHEARRSLEHTAAQYTARLRNRPSDVAWTQTLARFHGETSPPIPRRVLSLDAWVR